MLGIVGIVDKTVQAYQFRGHSARLARAAWLSGNIEKGGMINILGAASTHYNSWIILMSYKCRALTYDPHYRLLMGGAGPN